MLRTASPPPGRSANNGGAWPVDGSNVPLPGQEPGTAVVTRILGVHRGVPRHFRSAAPPQGSCRDQTTLFAFLQSNSVEPARQTPVHGSKLRRRLTCVRQTFPAWPGSNRHPNHPASLHQSLVMISRLVRRCRHSMRRGRSGDNSGEISDKGLNGLVFR